MGHASRGYSVLMSVYCREKPENLREAMESIWAQTFPAEDFVLVCDGPLGEELDKVVSDMERAHGDKLKIARLEENTGLWNALNVGMKLCAGGLVARMDSDDVSRPDRCERQLRVFSERPGTSIVSGTVEEFSGSVENITGRRVLPEMPEEILRFARKRNPFNHPCVMYRKADVESAGGYRDAYCLEDYDLWVRMLGMGFEGYNIREPLLWMRTDSGFYRRRSGIRYARSQKALFKYMKDSGFINGQEYMASVTTRMLSSALPNSARRSVFRIFLRESPRKRSEAETTI